MFKLTEINSSPIVLKDPQAIRMVKRRAFYERRPATNMLTMVVLEGLRGSAFDVDDTRDGDSGQPKPAGISAQQIHQDTGS